VCKSGIKTSAANTTSKLAKFESPAKSSGYKLAKKLKATK
jgi:hypothetical protein